MISEHLPHIPFTQLPKAIHSQQSEIFKIDIEIQNTELLKLVIEQGLDYEIAFSLPELKNELQRKAYREKNLFSNVGYSELLSRLQALRANKKLAENYLGYLLRLFEVGKRDLSDNF